MRRILLMSFATLLGVFVYVGLTGVEVQATQAGAPGDLIYVPVMVNDSKNVPVATLKQEDFQILEDNKEQKIVYFSGAGEPVSMGIVLGLSASGPVKSPSQRDRASVDILNAVERIREASGTPPTAAFDQVPLDSDAIFSIVARRAEALAKDPAPRKALIVVSDGLISSGMQPSNVPLPKAVIEASKVGHFPIHFVFLIQGSSAPSFTETSNYATAYYLEQMADFSGGEVVIGQIDNTLSRAATNFRDSLKNQYLIGYRSPNAAKDGKWRKLTVKINPAAGKLKVNARERYFVAK
jgi:Ca-activated chloride channel family protein